MPKLKNHSGASKRFRLTGKGKFKFRAGYRNHILTKRSTKRKRKLRAGSYIASCDQLSIDRLFNLR